MENQQKIIISSLVFCCVLLIITLAGFKWYSYQQDQLAQIELGKLGGTFTLRSAALLRETGSTPSSFDKLLITNPITEVNLSITSWPREKGIFPLVTDNDIKVIASLIYLQRLSLRGMPITDAAIDQLARFKNLKNLDVRETQLSAQGLSRLKEALPACEVVSENAG